MVHVSHLIGNAVVDSLELELDAQEARDDAVRSDAELSPEQADYLAARDQATRYSLGLYKLTCEGFAPTHEVADSKEKAWPQARKRGWAKGGDVVSVETVLSPANEWGSYPIEVVTESGWKHLCHIRARSARAAVTIISAKYPNHRLRAGSLLSVEAHRRIDATRRIAS
jgi:hypothetical protein